MRPRLNSEVSASHRVELPAYVRAVTDPYEEWCFWWEVPECMRKLLLSGLLSLVGPGSIEQLAVGMIVCVGFIAAYHHARPYESDFDDWLQFLCSASVFFGLLWAILMKGQPAVDSVGVAHDSIFLDVLLSVLTFLPSLLVLPMLLIEQRICAEDEDQRKARRGSEAAFSQRSSEREMESSPESRAQSSPMPPSSPHAPARAGGAGGAEPHGGWEKYQTNSGRGYYYHAQSRTSQWESPAPDDSPSAAPPSTDVYDSQYANRAGSLAHPAT